MKRTPGHIVPTSFTLAVEIESQSVSGFGYTHLYPLIENCAFLRNLQIAQWIRLLATKLEDLSLYS